MGTPVKDCNELLSCMECYTGGLGPASCGWCAAGSTCVSRGGQCSGGALLNDVDNCPAYMPPTSKKTFTLKTVSPLGFTCGAPAAFPDRTVTEIDCNPALNPGAAKNCASQSLCMDVLSYKLYSDYGNTGAGLFFLQSYKDANCTQRSWYRPPGKQTYPVCNGPGLGNYDMLWGPTNKTGFFYSTTIGGGGGGGTSAPTTDPGGGSTGGLSGASGLSSSAAVWLAPAALLLRLWRS